MIDNNGNKFYPYKKIQRSTNRYGFALTKPGENDRHGQGTYTENIEEVIKRLIFDGWNVRAKTEDGKKHGSYGMHKKAIHKYEIAVEFEHLVELAPVKPFFIFPSDKEKIKKEVNVIKEEPVDEITFKAIKSRRGQPEFRKALLKRFAGNCCVSGCMVESVLEAAHITPHNEETNYSLENGILLRADIHTLFDLNLLGIDSHGRICISNNLKESEYWQFHGKYIANNISEIMSSNLLRRYKIYENNNSIK